MWRKAIGVVAWITLCGPIAMAYGYPQIGALAPSDPLYNQHQEDLRLFFARSNSGRELPPLLLYSFDAEEHDSLLTVSARLSLPYSAIATLNGLTGTDLELDHRFLLVPSLPGLFIPVEPRNYIDRLLADLRRQELEDAIAVTLELPDGDRRRFYFLAGEDFTPGERRDFLGSMFVMPVRTERITSRFGYRLHPITGVVQFHRGVDLAAPLQAPVVAAADGVVKQTGSDPLLGTYIIMEHRGGYETYYAHLAKSLVSLKDTVASGTMIGRVGTTGLTTGPHLHFEIRESGTPRNPLRMLPALRSRTD